MAQRGLEHTRRFCPHGTHPYETVEWTTYDAVIENPKTGETVFEQKSVVFPESWSQQSVNIVASKYFFGDLDAENGSPAEGKREYRLKQLVDRVADTIAEEGYKRGYFRTLDDKGHFLMDLKWLLLHQHAAFNSPVWFNVGLGQTYGVKEGDEQNLLFNKNSPEEPVEEVDPYVFPQAAACFIVEMEDDIDAIWDTMKESARLFKFGSGVGADWSSLRSSKERVSGGGTASGPVPFMRVQDATGATIKSGGKTRRAAIMQILRADHPDVWDFVNVKRDEEKKAHSLIKDGYDPSFNGEAYQTVDFQDVNQSVRIDDDFFKTIDSGEEPPQGTAYKTKAVTDGRVLGSYEPYQLLREIARNTHQCGDPGIQYDGAIQRWHTCPQSGRINGSNPCSEFLFLDNTACNLASINLRKMETENGWDPKRLQGTAEVMFTAQDILCDIAGYPSEDIAEMSENFRPLGLGFANLGATLMQKGIAYDSNEGRAIAAGLQSIIHFAAYNRSTKMAKALEPFSKYEKNEEDFVEVMTQHMNVLADLVHGNHEYLSAITEEDNLPCENASELMLYAKKLAGEMYKRGEQHGYRNSQATVIAPTGTISFYMGCTTTGIEPSPALVQYKALAGSEDSMIKIVNDCVGEAILALGYDPDAATLVEEYVKSNDTIEGVNEVLRENGYQGLTGEEMEVFDTAMSQGDHSIDPSGHIEMMAAVQPFVSGAISKCVTGDTLITTENGLVPIQDYYHESEPDSFRECETQLESVDGLRDADKFYYGGVRPTVELTLDDGRTIEGTPNHRVRVADGEVYRWKELRNITDEDHVAIRLGADQWAEDNAEINFTGSELYGSQKEIELPSKLSPELGWLLGAFASEGSVIRDTWTVRITNNCDEVLNKAQDHFRLLFGLDSTRSIDSRNGVKEVVVHSKTLVEFLDYIGCGDSAGSKEIPRAVLQSRREVVREFLGGLYLDGYVRDKDGMVAICLKSESLIRQLQVVLNNFGVRANIHHKYDKEYERYFHELCAHGHDVVLFDKLVTLDEPDKERALNQAATTLSEKPTYSHSDVLPCHRDELKSLIRDDSATHEWRSVFDKRTNHISRDLASRVYEEYEASSLSEIMENDIHFVQVQEIGSGFEEVYDFHVPSNNTFIGNSIVNHNTVNLPENATVEDVEDAYLRGWDLGLKALAIYRDGSKDSQPVNTTDGSEESDDQEEDQEGFEEAVGEELEYAASLEIIDSALEDGKVTALDVIGQLGITPSELPIGSSDRRKLPDQAPSIRRKFQVGGTEGYIHVGLYPDTKEPGEVFITVSKEGSTLAGVMDSFATSISLALQYGVPLEDLVEKFKNQRFEPSGFTGDDIQSATSIVDYVAKFLEQEFLEEETRDVNFSKPQVTQASENADEPAEEHFGETLDEFAERVCENCGSIMRQDGTCFVCPTCGEDTGCGG